MNHGGRVYRRSRVTRRGGDAKKKKKKKRKTRAKRASKRASERTDAEYLDDPINRDIDERGAGCRARFSLLRVNTTRPIFSPPPVPTIPSNPRSSPPLALLYFSFHCYRSSSPRISLPSFRAIPSSSLAPCLLFCPPAPFARTLFSKAKGRDPGAAVS